MKKRILMIVGSMRKRSFNRQVAAQVERLVDKRAEVRYLDYADLPFMNQDIEYPAPALVKRVRAEVLQADGLWICSPEYNGTIPGVLKNLLDWLSRPFVENDWSSGSAARGKVIAISSAAGKSAGAGCRAALAQVLSVLRMDLVGGAGVGITLSPEAFSTDSIELSDTDISALEAQVDAFCKRIGA